MRWLREFMSLPIYLRWMLAVDLVCNFGNGLVWPIELLFATHSLGASMSQATLTVTVSSIGSLISHPAIGWLSDKRSSWLAMHLGLVFAILGPVLFAVSLTFPMALLAAFVSGLGMGTTTAWTSILTQISTSEQKNIVYGINQAEMNLGVGLGAAVGGIVAASRSDFLFRLSFAARGAGFVFVSIALILIERHFALRALTRRLSVQAREVQVTAPSSSNESGEHSTLNNPRSALVAMALLTTATLFMNIFGYSQFDSGVVTTLISNDRIPRWSLSLIDVVNTFAVVVLNVILLPRLKNGRHMVMLRTVPICWAAAWFLIDLGLTCNSSLAALTVASIGITVFGFGEVMLGISQPVVAARLAGPRFSGRMFGLLNMAQSLGYVLGPMFAAWVLTAPRPIPLLTLSAIALLLTSLPWLFAIRLPRQARVQQKV
ncbi:hypothetical protein KIM372_07050 [Bombiscardovia nodaiensis]|uniref:Major facilitator superfamily (MFS) profile domain-containing protein n=1 Tax=Bombiscardovia nodaiensis TaxID=2932181 RepID=A0ABN6SBE8_9BIFI|nr:hypothetical protein KIM372_07050 [Bombiscardovia nodaiensis]